MQFVTNGPDIPNELLQAHEEGNVVFFCGAGISYPAGLPGFKGLVDKIYENIGENKSAIENETYSEGKFDATLDLLERRIIGQRQGGKVRKALKGALKPNLDGNATNTHKALLKLACNNTGKLRLVTTNFDRIFEHVRLPQNNTYLAPLLPIPKNSSWDGLVYLHGLLPENDDITALQRLVFTSGDFGLAYLTERWAARFVGELFRNYIVCFVGYSIDDPVLRYMMDALAADRNQGETVPQAYAFGDFSSGNKDSKETRWKAKGVIPILYKVHSGRNPHSILHKTLKEWAQTYEEGTTGKERIVTEYAIAHPSESTQQDDFVGRMIWALSDKDGLPAKLFAEFDPVPSLDWLKFFSEKKFKHKDLPLFRVTPEVKVDDKLTFSLIHRPAPYNKAPWMSILGDPTDSKWDAVMKYIASWLLRHLNNPDLIIWLTEQGSNINGQFLLAVECQLDKIQRLTQEESEEIIKNAPNAIPDKFMKTLWRIFLTGKIKNSCNLLSYFSWEQQINQEGLNIISRLGLRDLLSPVVKISKAFSLKGGNNNNEPKQRISWEIVLKNDDIIYSVRDKSIQKWQDILPDLFSEFQQLLLDALDLYRELDQTDNYHDRSNFDLPSISDHNQNQYYEKWVILVLLLRDSWLKILETEPAKATILAKNWFNYPYPVFKRLALFAASQNECIEPEIWVAWLTENDAWCLWAGYTMRETMRLLVIRGQTLKFQTKVELEKIILKGPPQKIGQDHDYSIWLRLAKLQNSGCILSDSASQKLNELSEANPKWEIDENELDEFCCFCIGTGDIEYEENLEIDEVPSECGEIIKWLNEPKTKSKLFYKDKWNERCKENHLEVSKALSFLAIDGNWYVDRWTNAFYVWSNDDDIAIQTWNILAPIIKIMPKKIFKEAVYGIVSWLKAVAKSLESYKSIFFELCRRVMELPPDDQFTSEDILHKAVNYPIGHITSALINLWFKENPNDDDTLPDDIKEFFSKICDINNKHFIYGRVILASRAIALFRVDYEWTKKYLLPLFDWETNKTEALGAWSGFLWSPRLYWPLLLEIKSSFLSTARHYEDIGKHGRQYVTFLTFASLFKPDEFSNLDFRKAIELLPQEGLIEVVRALYQAFEGAADKQNEYLENRIIPFWNKIWPKYNDNISPDISQTLTRLCIKTADKFPAVVKLFYDWLIPFQHIHLVLKELLNSGLLPKFPRESLNLLGKIIDNQPWPTDNLRPCLDSISKADPNLLEDNSYKRIDKYLRGKNL